MSVRRTCIRAESATPATSKSAPACPESPGVPDSALACPPPLLRGLLTGSGAPREAIPSDCTDSHSMNTKEPLQRPAHEIRVDWLSVWPGAMAAQIARLPATSGRAGHIPRMGLRWPAPVQLGLLTAGEDGASQTVRPAACLRYCWAAFCRLTGHSSVVIRSVARSPVAIFHVKGSGAQAAAAVTRQAGDVWSDVTQTDCLIPSEDGLPCARGRHARRRRRILRCGDGRVTRRSDHSSCVAPWVQSQTACGMSQTLSRRKQRLDACLKIRRGVQTAGVGLREQCSQKMLSWADQVKLHNMNRLRSIMA